MGHKTFFQDEAYSALRITGHLETDYLRFRDGRVRPVRDVAAFQQIDATSSVGSTLTSIATEEPQRGPLYFAIAALWVRAAGTSIIGFRSLSVLFGLLAVGAAYVFGHAYFQSRRGGAIVSSLVALSPFHILYAQQAREYGLLTLVIFASAAAFFQATRSGGVRGWTIFAVALIAGLLSSPFFFLVVISYATYAVFLASAERSGRSLARFSLSTVVAMLAVSPWYAYALRSAGRVGEQTNWGVVGYPIEFYATKWVFNFGAVFFDYEFADVRYAAVLVVLLPCVVYLAYLGIRSFPEIGRFALALAAPTVLVIVGNDIRSGAHFGTIPRYLTPLWIALEIVVAAAIVPATSSLRKLSARIALVCGGIIVAGGVFSAIGDARFAMWWSNNDNEPTEAIARIVNVQPRPIVATSNFAIALSLEHYLQPRVRLQIYTEDRPPPLNASGAPNFLFIPTEPSRRAILTRYPDITLRPVIAEDETSAYRFHDALAKERSGGDSPVATALWIVGARERSI